MSEQYGWSVLVAPAAMQWLSGVGWHWWVLGWSQWVCIGLEVFSLFQG